MYDANCITYQMEDNNHIKSLVEVYHLGHLYLNLKDQGVQYDVLVSNWQTNKKKHKHIYLKQTFNSY
jgi:hypothetical protein